MARRLGPWRAHGRRNRRGRGGGRSYARYRAGRVGACARRWRLGQRGDGRRRRRAQPARQFSWPWRASGRHVVVCGFIFWAAQSNVGRNPCGGLGRHAHRNAAVEGARCGFFFFFLEAESRDEAGSEPGVFEAESVAGHCWCATRVPRHTHGRRRATQGRRRVWRGLEAKAFRHEERPRWVRCVPDPARGGLGAHSADGRTAARPCGGRGRTAAARRTDCALARRVERRGTRSAAKRTGPPTVWHVPRPRPS